MNDIVFDQNYFPKEIEFWYTLKEELGNIKSNFDAAEDVPQLSPKVSAALDTLIPALNQAKQDISHNMKIGSEAADCFAVALTTVGKNYGVTEEKAAEIAKKVEQNV